MKIVYKKGLNINMILRILNGLLVFETEEFPILKDDMVIELTLKNNIGKDNPYNETEIYLGENEINDLIEGYGLYDAGAEEEQWISFIANHSDSIKKQIEKDKNRVEKAREKRMKELTIKKREEDLKISETLLQYEKERIKKLQPFKELYEKKQITYKYVYELADHEIHKRIYFNINGELYYFTYRTGPGVSTFSDGEKCICNQADEIILYWNDFWNCGGGCTFLEQEGMIIPFPYNQKKHYL